MTLCLASRLKLRNTRRPRKKLSRGSGRDISWYRVSAQGDQTLNCHLSHMGTYTTDFALRCVPAGINCDVFFLDMRIHIRTEPSIYSSFLDLTLCPWLHASPLLDVSRLETLHYHRKTLYPLRRRVIPGTVLATIIRLWKFRRRSVVRVITTGTVIIAAVETLICGLLRSESIVIVGRIQQAVRELNLGAELGRRRTEVDVGGCRLGRRSLQRCDSFVRCHF